MKPKIIKYLTKGMYGEIYLLHNNDVYKKLKKTIEYEIFIDSTTLREICILEYLNHPNIIKPINIYFDIMQEEIGYSMKRYPMTLHDIISELNFSEIKQITHSLLLAVYNCHANFVVHRDIKPTNILVEKINDMYNIKLIDFGLAKFDFFYDNNTKLYPIFQQECEIVQTLWYRSPEIILESSNTNYKIDMWSIGLILYEMFIENTIFKTKNSQAQLNNYIKYIKYNHKFDELDKYMIDNNIKFDIKFDNDVINYLENKDAIDLLRKLLEFNPDNRITCRDAINHKFFADINQGKIINDSFFSFSCTMKKLNICKLDYNKLTYSRDHMLYMLKKAEINSIMGEWIFYMVDYYLLNTYNNNLTVTDLFIFNAYLFLKIYINNNVDFINISKLFNVIIPENKLYYFNFFEI